MNTAGLLFLILTQFLAGRGVMALFGIRQKPVYLFTISTFIGIGILSLLPMLIEMLGMTINKTNILIAICAITVALNVPVIRKYDFSIFKKMKFTMPKLYELAFVIFFIVIMAPAVWHGYFYPPQARDVLSGPEALADYALKEGTLNNSVFTLNLDESVPNLMKPPYVTNLQIVYKMFVQPFGQFWLTIMAVCFLVWIYCIIRERLHPVVAGFLMLFFITIPEMYGYTYIMLWDYCNAVYFTVGAYFLIQYLLTNKYNYFLFSALLFGFATFVRVETPIFVGLLSPILIYGFRKGDVKLPKLAINFVLLAVIPFLFYFIWVNIFAKYYLPVHIDAGGQMNLSSETSYFDWLSQFNNDLIFGGMNIMLYGYFIYFFILVVILNAIFFRPFSIESKFMLWAVLIVYLGMPLLGYATVWFNITTAKRGFFKMFPFMLLYMSHSGLFTRLSDALKKFEFPDFVSNDKPAKPVVQPAKAPAANTNKNKPKK